MWGHSYCLGMERIFWKWWLSAWPPSTKWCRWWQSWLLDLCCPSYVAFLCFLEDTWPDVSQFSAATPAQGVCWEICMLWCPVELLSAPEAAFMALNQNQFQIFISFTSFHSLFLSVPLMPTYFGVWSPAKIFPSPWCAFPCRTQLSQLPTCVVFKDWVYGTSK